MMGWPYRRAGSRPPAESTARDRRGAKPDGAYASGAAFRILCLAAVMDVSGDDFTEGWWNSAYGFPLSVKKEAAPLLPLGPTGTQTRNPRVHNIHGRAPQTARASPKSHTLVSLAFRNCLGFVGPKDFRMIS